MLAICRECLSAEVQNKSIPGVNLSCSTLKSLDEEKTFSKPVDLKIFEQADARERKREREREREREVYTREVYTSIYKKRYFRIVLTNL